MEELASGNLTAGGWGECLRWVGAEGAVNGRCVWGKMAKSDVEETTNFPACQCGHMVLAPYRKIILLSPPILSPHSCFYFRVPCLFLWEQKFSPRIS